jgi:hypothetical protein
MNLERVVVMDKPVFLSVYIVRADSGSSASLFFFYLSKILVRYIYIWMGSADGFV